MTVNEYVILPIPGYADQEIRTVTSREHHIYNSATINVRFGY